MTSSGATYLSCKASSISRPYFLKQAYMVTDEEIVEILQIGKPEEQLEHLVECALEHGGRGNITVIVCQVEAEKQKGFLSKLAGQSIKSGNKKERVRWIKSSMMK